MTKSTPAKHAYVGQNQGTPLRKRTTPIAQRSLVLAYSDAVEELQAAWLPMQWQCMLGARHTRGHAQAPDHVAKLLLGAQDVEGLALPAVHQELTQCIAAWVVQAHLQCRWWHLRGRD